METTFNTLINGTTHNLYGVVGTNHQTRTQVWEQFKADHPNGVKIAIEGFEFELKAFHSLSGKSTSYSAEITHYQYIQLGANKSNFGLSSKKSRCPHITINNGFVSVDNGGSYSFLINNSEITILN